MSDDKVTIHDIELMLLHDHQEILDIINSLHAHALGSLPMECGLCLKACVTSSNMKVIGRTAYAARRQ